MQKHVDSDILLCVVFICKVFQSVLPWTAYILSVNKYRPNQMFNLG